MMMTKRSSFWEYNERHSDSKLTWLVWNVRQTKERNTEKEASPAWGERLWWACRVWSSHTCKLLQKHWEYRHRWTCLGVPQPLTEVPRFFETVYSDCLPGQDCFSFGSPGENFHSLSPFHWLFTTHPLRKKQDSTYLIQTKKPQISQHVEGTDSGSCGDLPSYLQANLNNFQGVSKDDLRATGL